MALNSAQKQNKILSWEVEIELITQELEKHTEW
jgi:hypothetical protein